MSATPARWAPSERVDASWRFFALTFAWTWLLQWPAVLAQQGWLPGPLVLYMPWVVLGVLGPSAAALLLVFQRSGREGVRRLFSGLARYRVHPAWYFVALCLPGLCLTLGCLGLRQVGYNGDVRFVPEPGRLAVGLFISLGEELGWRGYALPQLQRRYGPVAASGVIGIFWTLWHIPMFVGAGTPLTLLPVVLLQLLGGSLLFTWIYNRTGQSLLLCVLAHFGAHLNNPSLALPHNTLPLLVHALCYALLGTLAVALDRRAFPHAFRR